MSKSKRPALSWGKTREEKRKCLSCEKDEGKKRTNAYWRGSKREQRICLPGELEARNEVALCVYYVEFLSQTHCLTITYLWGRSTPFL